ncbi:MAG: helix-turn-helix transcriptional regulator [Chloroflexi bacterium]|nr:helix-turn-helix transcriptional regulator [Chloroflexota bacterium]
MDAKDSEGDVNTQGHRQIYPLHSSSQLLLPKSATWKGIGIEHHLQPPAECEMCLPQYLICILLSECETERRENGGHLHRNHVQSGQVIVYPSASEHWIRWQENTEFLLLLLDPDLVTRTADELTPRNIVEIIESEERDDPLIQQIGLALKNEIDEGMITSSSIYAESLANALSAHLLRHYNVWKPALREDVGKYSASTLRHVIEYIHDNIDQHLTLAELSLVADMSTYHFARTFKQVTGVTPHQYVLNVRIERAKELLLQGRLTIAEIASKVGFFDQSHFTRYFKRLVGVTPQTLLHQNSKNLPK